MALNVAQLRTIFAKLRKIGKKVSPYRRYKAGELRKLRKRFVGGLAEKAYKTDTKRKLKKSGLVGMGLTGAGLMGLGIRKRIKKKK